MLLEIKKQLEDTIKCQQLLKKLPIQKMLPLNSICYLDVNIKKQEKCIISLEADYAAEVSLQKAGEILQRKKQRLEETFYKLREGETYDEMQYDLGQKIDENLEKKEIEEQKKKVQENEQKQQDQDQIQKQIEKNKEKELEQQKKQNQSNAKGNVTDLGDDQFEITEQYIPEEEQKYISEEKKKLICLISDAFYENNQQKYDQYSEQLNQLNQKSKLIQKQQQIIQNKNDNQTQQLPVIEENEQPEYQEQPKRISKFKQERLKNKK